MNKTTPIVFAISFLLITTITNAADKGVINFNLGKSPVNDSPVQAVTLYGCNQVINSNLFWDTDNQIVGNIPYGWHKTESGKKYHVSRYYIASPPAFRKGSPPSSSKQQPYIGLVTPDTFTFEGKKPGQIVYFDYRILEPTYLDFVSIDYQHKNDHGDSCASLGVDLIPVNTQCENFPWRNGALGASGIGEITQDSNRVFLPLKGEAKQPLQCKVTILDDILLDHKVFIATKNGKKKKTVSLTKYHEHDNSIKLICLKRDEEERPAGCKL